MAVWQKAQLYRGSHMMLGHAEWMQVLAESCLQEMEHLLT